MSLAKRVADLEARLPNIQVVKFDNTTQGPEVRSFKLLTMANTETLKYFFSINNAIKFLEDNLGVVTTTPAVSAQIRRIRNKVESTLSGPTVSAFDAVNNRYTVTVNLAKTNVAKGDTILIDFSAPFAVTYTQRINIL